MRRLVVGTLRQTLPQPASSEPYLGVVLVIGAVGVSTLLTAKWIAYAGTLRGAFAIYYLTAIIMSRWLNSFYGAGASALLSGVIVGEFLTPADAFHSYGRPHDLLLLVGLNSIPIIIWRWRAPVWLNWLRNDPGWYKQQCRMGADRAKRDLAHMIADDAAHQLAWDVEARAESGIYDPAAVGYYNHIARSAMLGERARISLALDDPDNLVASLVAAKIDSLVMASSIGDEQRRSHKLAE